MNVIGRAHALAIVALLAGASGGAVGAGDSRAPMLQDCPTCPVVLVISPHAESACGERGTDMPLPAPYSIGRTEVTFDEWDPCVADGACRAIGDRGWGRGNRPALDITWYDAMRYVGWLSRRTGQRYRLPTEAEWEYAARGGRCSTYSYGDDPAQLCRYANGSDLTGKREGMKVYNDACADGYGIRTSPAGSFLPNDYGLYDVHGNVWEWTRETGDDAVDLTEGNVCTAPVMPPPPDDASKRHRVARGGSWGLNPPLLTSRARISLDACMRGFHLGLRVVREVPVGH
jgi:formylglycine-generating enzyme required for sulfatase activity